MYTLWTVALLIVAALSKPTSPLHSRQTCSQSKPDEFNAGNQRISSQLFYLKALSKANGTNLGYIKTDASPYALLTTDRSCASPAFDNFCPVYYWSQVFFWFDSTNTSKTLFVDDYYLKNTSEILPAQVLNGCGGSTMDLSGSDYCQQEQGAVCGLDDTSRLYTHTECYDGPCFPPVTWLVCPESKLSRDSFNSSSGNNSILFFGKPGVIVPSGCTAVDVAGDCV